MASHSREVLLTKKLFEDIGTKEGKQKGEEEDESSILVVVDPEEWEREQEACRKDQKVIALEITNPFSESCGRIRSLFARLAKEFEGLPFIRVITGPFQPFITTDKICHDVGAVKELPAILLLYYDRPGHIKRKSYQGESTIRGALENGELKLKFKDFIDGRHQQMLEESMNLKQSENEYRDNVSKQSRSTSPSEDELVKNRKRLPAEDNILPLPIPEEESEEEDDTDCKTTSTQYQPGANKDTSKTDDDNSFRHPTMKTSESFCQSTTASQLSTSHAINKGDITVGEKIGQGGFGTVYQALWKKKKVAVKVCSGNLLEQGGAEVDILASLPSHPNVLTFFGVAVSEDKISSLIVTELAFGGSLYSCLHGKKREIPTTDQSLGWAFQIASGMEYLHSHNVIHRDLKSPNVLLSFGKQAMICDFGTARQLSETCISTKQAGTYRWMAPEIAEECYAKISSKCDVFSYGMILYEIYALKLPFGDISNDVMVCNAIMEGKRPSIPERLPSFLHPLLQDCWDKEPTQRPSFETIVMTIRTEFYEKENEQ